MDLRGEYKNLVKKGKEELPKTKGYESWSKFGDKVSKTTLKVHLPKKAKKMSYKTSNPLKKLLSHKRPTIRVRGY